MITEAIECLVGLADERRRPYVMHCNRLEKLYYMPDGSLSVQKILPNPRDHTVYDIEGLVTACMRCLPVDDDRTDRMGGVLVWHDSEAVRVALDNDAMRHDYICMPLRQDPVFQQLRRMKGGGMEAREAVHLLKHDLRGAVPANVTNALSSLRFTSHGEQSAEVAHGRESMGRSIDLAVADAEKVPESFLASTKVWLHHDYMADITVTIRLAPEDQKVHICPALGEIDRALQQACSWMGEQLAGEFRKENVIFGCPNEGE